MSLFTAKLDGFRPMVMSAAWKAWRRLPRQTQSWIAPEDMIQDGLEWMYLETKKRWRPVQASLSTFLFVALEHFYYDHYVAKYGRPTVNADGRRMGSEKRWEGQNESIGDKQQWCAELGLEFELERAFGIRVRASDEEDKRIQCAMVRALEEVYWASSGMLQVQMVHWFLQESNRRRLDGTEFKKARTEFRTLAAQYQIGIEECRHVFDHPECRKELKREFLRFGLPATSGKFDLVTLRKRV